MFYEYVFILNEFNNKNYPSKKFIESINIKNAYIFLRNSNKNVYGNILAFACKIIKRVFV